MYSDSPARPRPEYLYLDETNVFLCVHEDAFFERHSNRVRNELKRSTAEAEDLIKNPFRLRRRRQASTLQFEINSTLNYIMGI